jgi:glycosyltransferase involved in cell wall biosynthesis
MQKKLISIITPIFNESEMIEEYLKSLNAVIEKINNFIFEIIFIDDGSTDGGYQILKNIAALDEHIIILKLSRNFGKDIALAAGFDYASGDAVIPMDADLQDSPEIIPQMINSWQDGFKIVLAERSDRDDPWFKKITAKIFYKLAAKVMDRNLPQNVGDFRLIDKVVLAEVKKLREKSRFTRGILSWPGFSSQTIKYQRGARFKGKTKYSYIKLFNYALDGLFSFSTFPIRLITYFGFLTSLMSFCFGFVIILNKIFSDNYVIPGYASLMSIILFLGGVNFIFIGVIGEYIGRIFNEVKDRPLYVIEEVIEKNPKK